MATLGKSRSLPGLLKLGTAAPPLGDQLKKSGSTISYRLDSPLDVKKGGTAATEKAQQLAEMLRTPGWRLLGNERPPTPTAPEDSLPKNMIHPRVAPAWLKHDKQTLRFYAYFQESVVERADENSLVRNVVICYHMEDGTMSIREPRVENSGIPQGPFLKRSHVPREDGEGFLGPDDLRCGEPIVIFGRKYRIRSCDRFTRWFYEQNGIEVGDDEPEVEDLWRRSYRFKTTAEKGGLPITRSAMEAKTMTKYVIGQPAPKQITQFLMNDRKVLRFKGFWDDTTLYGARMYFVIHYYLSDNTVEINEAHARNSGRDNYPVFLKRGPLYKKNQLQAFPGSLKNDGDPYMPEDLIVGQAIQVWNRKVMLYDCDDFTRNFYQSYMGIDQFDGKIDVSEKPLRHRKLLPPPHSGVGSAEDSLISCTMLAPKPAKVDLVRLMTYSGENLRFEATMDNGEPEDATRRLIISLYPETMPITVSVFEMQARNSGHMGGRFAERKRITNPDTGKYFELADFFVGQTVTIAAQPLRIVKADEHALQFMEAHPNEFPMASPDACAKRLSPLAAESEMRDEAGIDPDRLKELAADHGVHIVDHEVITLLRHFNAGIADGGTPLISGPRVLQAIIG